MDADLIRMAVGTTWALHDQSAHIVHPILGQQKG